MVGLLTCIRLRGGVSWELIDEVHKYEAKDERQANPGMW